MVRFLLLIEKIPEYTKKIIDAGLTPHNVYKLCSCIRETFCLSYSIRKNNDLYLYFQEDYALIIFLGNELRYLGPDERSQALLLEKALKPTKDLKNLTTKGLKKSTPGIYYTKFFDQISFVRYLISIATGSTYLLIEKNRPLNEKIKVYNLEEVVNAISDEDFYIIPTFNLEKKSDFISELVTQL
ncbi:MAG: hypothetical protein ACFE8N_07875, partial [Promethearchaeota archaeon]